MKKLLSIVLLLCIVMSMCTVSAWAVAGHTQPYDVNGVGFDTWAAAQVHASAISGDITITFTGELEINVGGTGGAQQIFNTTGKVSFIGEGSATFTTVGGGVSALYQPGGLYFYNLTFNDRAPSYSPGAWEMKYTEIMGPATFERVTFGPEDGVMVEGGSVVFNACRFEGTDTAVKESQAHYGLWISGGNVAVYGSTFVGTRGIKVHKDYAQSQIVLEVNNSDFTGLTNKPALVADVLAQWVTYHNIVMNNNNYGSTGIVEVSNQSYNITINPSPVTINPATAQLSKGETVQLTAAAQGIVPDGVDLSPIWVSSNPEVATVDANGLVTAVSTGQTVISCVLGNTTIAGSCTVTVAGVENMYYIPSTDDNSNMALWSILALALLSTAFVTRKRKNEN